jgi:protein-disulfide isomerase
VITPMPIGVNSREQTPRVLLAVLWIAACAVGDFPRLSQAEGITAEQADAILQELRQIRQLLERQQQDNAARPGVAAAPAPDEKVTLSLPANSYSLGRQDAPLTLVEYTDYQCPFCRQFHITAFEELKKNYIETGKLRYVSLDFPLELHENANRAAIAARCAGDQGRFWELRHVMIVNANRLKPENLLTYATDLQLDLDQFRACVESDKYRAEVDRQLADGQAIGISGTPTFVLGRTGADKLDGIRLVGAMPYSVFDGKIKELFATAIEK